MLESHSIKFYSRGHAESSCLSLCKADTVRAGSLEAEPWNEPWNSHSLGPSTSQLPCSVNSPGVLVSPTPQGKQVQESLSRIFLKFYHQRRGLTVR